MLFRVIHAPQSYIPGPGADKSFYESCLAFLDAMNGNCVMVMDKEGDIFAGFIAAMQAWPGKERTRLIKMLTHLNGSKRIARVPLKKHDTPAQSCTSIGCETAIALARAISFETFAATERCSCATDVIPANQIVYPYQYGPMHPFRYEHERRRQRNFPNNTDMQRIEEEIWNPIFSVASEIEVLDRNIARTTLKNAYDIKNSDKSTAALHQYNRDCQNQLQEWDRLQVGNDEDLEWLAQTIVNAKRNGTVNVHLHTEIGRINIHEGGYISAPEALVKATKNALDARLSRLKHEWSERGLNISWTVYLGINEHGKTALEMAHERYIKTDCMMVEVGRGLDMREKRINGTVGSKDLSIKAILRPSPLDVGAAADEDRADPEKIMAQLGKLVVADEVSISGLYTRNGAK